MAPNMMQTATAMPVCAPRTGQKHKQTSFVTDIPAAVKHWEWIWEQDYQG